MIEDVTHRQERLDEKRDLHDAGLGAAALAGLAVGVFASRDDVKRVWQQDASFSPSMTTEALGKKLAT